MIKLVYAMHRRSDLDPEEFHRYWLEQHGPLVAKHAETLRIRRYVQSHRLGLDVDQALAAARGTDVEPYDGVAELWVDSLEDLQAAYAGEAAQRASAELLEDEARFIDFSTSTLWFAEEHVIVERSPTGGLEDTSRPL